MANPPIVIGPFDNVPAPGSPIRSDWPQEISQYVSRPLPYCRFAQPQLAIPPAVDTTFTFSGLVNVLDPNAMIGPNYVVIPPGWSGLWLFEARYEFGPNGGGATVAAWLNYAAARYGQAQITSHAVNPYMSAGGAVIPAVAGQGLTIVARNNNAAPAGVGVMVTATWLGISPV